MTLNKYYGLLVGLLVASGSCVVAMDPPGPQGDIVENSNNEQEICYFCTDELNGTAVRLSKNCVHELHQACYDTVIADKRTNTHCGMCWALIVKPVAPEKAGSSKVRRAVSTSERTKRLMQLDLMARDKKLFGGIAKSQELSALRDKREISQADYTAILGYVAKNDASGLIEFLKKFLRKRHALTRTHKVV